MCLGSSPSQGEVQFHSQWKKAKKGGRRIERADKPEKPSATLMTFVTGKGEEEEERRGGKAKGGER